MLFNINVNASDKIKSNYVNVITTPPVIEELIIKCKFCSDMNQTDLNSTENCSCGWDWN